MKLDTYASITAAWNSISSLNPSASIARDRPSSLRPMGVQPGKNANPNLSHFDAVIPDGLRQDPYILAQLNPSILGDRPKLLLRQRLQPDQGDQIHANC